VTVPSLLPADEAIIVEIGVGLSLGDVTVTGVGEMHSSIQYSGQVTFCASEQSSGISSRPSHLVLSFVQSTILNSMVGTGVGFDVGPGVGSGEG